MLENKIHINLKQNTTIKQDHLSCQYQSNFTRMCTESVQDNLINTLSRKTERTYGIPVFLIFLECINNKDP